MKKISIITFFLFSMFSYVDVDAGYSHKEGTVREATEVKRDLYYTETLNDGHGWPYKYCVAITYKLIFDDETTLLASLFERMNTTSENEIPEGATTLINYFIIVPGDTLSFVYGSGPSYWMTINRNHLKMYGYFREQDGDFFN